MPGGEHDGSIAALVHRAIHAPSPFYRQRLASAGLDTGVTLTSLSRLPLTRREDLLRDQHFHPPHGTRRFQDAALPVRVGTTGSGEDLLLLAWSAADLAREQAAGVRLFGHLGIAAGMRVANALPGALVTPGALLVGDAIEELGGLDIPLGALDTKADARRAWELVDRVRPAAIILEAATARRLFAEAPPAARPWWQIIIWLERDVATSPATVPVPPAAGFAGDERRWLAVAEATSFVAWSCAAGNLHVEAELVTEVVEPADGWPLGAGQSGRLALTPLGLELPLLRYDSGIAARIPAGACRCGAMATLVEIDGTGAVPR